MCRRSAMALKVTWVATLCISTGPWGGPGQGCLEGWLPECTEPPAGAAVGPGGVPTAEPVLEHPPTPSQESTGRRHRASTPRAAVPLFLLPPAP